MLCSHCKKKEAVFLLKTVVKKRLTQLKLCHNCLNKKEKASGLDEGSILFYCEPLGSSALGRDILPYEKKGLFCAYCGLYYSVFRAEGKLGCPNCYLGFRPHIKHLIKSYSAAVGENEVETAKFPIISFGKKDNIHIKDLPKYFKAKKLLNQNLSWIMQSDESNIVIFTKSKLSKNLAGFKFSNKCSDKELEVILKTIANALLKISGLKKSVFINLGSADDIDKRFLIERNILESQFFTFSKQSAILADKEGKYSAIINGDEHLYINVIKAGFCPVEVSDIAGNIDHGLSLNYAKDGRFGFLTCDFENSGTGLEISCLMHLAGLVKSGRFLGAVKNLKSPFVSWKSMISSSLDISGDFYIVSSRIGFSSKEQDIIECISDAVKFLISAEKEARNWLFSDERKIKTEDEIFRSLGILQYARAISYEEASGHLSNLRLGISFGMQLPVNLNIVDKILINSQPANIMLKYSKQLNVYQRDIKRAEMIRSALNLSVKP